MKTFLIWKNHMKTKLISNNYKGPGIEIKITCDNCKYLKYCDTENEYTCDFNNKTIPWNKETPDWCPSLKELSNSFLNTVKNYLLNNIKNLRSFTILDKADFEFKKSKSSDLTERNNLIIKLNETIIDYDSE